MLLGVIEERGGRAALEAGAFARDATLGFSTRCGRRRGEECSCTLRCVEGKQVRAGNGSYFMVGIAWADRANLRLSALPGRLCHALHHHGAVMLAVAATADRQPSVRILREGQRRSDGRKTGGGEQDEAKETRQHKR